MLMRNQHLWLLRSGLNMAPPALWSILEPLPWSTNFIPQLGTFTTKGRLPGKKRKFEVKNLQNLKGRNKLIKLSFKVQNLSIIFQIRLHTLHRDISPMYPIYSLSGCCPFWYPVCVCVCVCMWTQALSHFSRVWLLMTPWTVAFQAPLPMGLSGQEYWSGFVPSSKESSWPREWTHISYVSYIGR